MVIRPVNQPAARFSKLVGAVSALIEFLFKCKNKTTHIYIYMYSYIFIYQCVPGAAGASPFFKKYTQNMKKYDFFRNMKHLLRLLIELYLGEFGLQIRNLHAKIYIMTCSNHIFMIFSKSGLQSTLGCTHFSGFTCFS